MWRGQLAYALPFALAVGIEILQTNFHQYVVATRFDAATFAIFAVGVLQMPLVDIIATSAASVMMVKISAGGDRDGRAALALWHDTIVRLSLVVFPLVAFMLIAAQDLIVLVFTNAYAASVPIFQLSTIALLPACLCVDAVLRAHAQTRALFVLNLVRLAVVAALIGALLTVFGLRGAVAATLCATVLARALGLARIARILHLRLVEILPWKQLTTTATLAVLAALPAVWVHRLLPSTGAVALVVVAGVYGITFMGLSLWKGSLSWFSMVPET
jgi:O-antigen/teichoic acid export membrane protein